jgi:hypothetical protein
VSRGAGRGVELWGLIAPESERCWRSMGRMGQRIGAGAVVMLYEGEIAGIGGRHTARCEA